jgi:putative sigma-54 modulation protein
MQITIQSRGFYLTEALRSHIERRIRFALGRSTDQVRSVNVNLSDLNGPRGGEDKRCQVRVAAAGVAGVIVEDVEADLYVAIDRAADRAGRTLERRLTRSHEHRDSRPSFSEMLAFTFSPASTPKAGRTRKSGSSGSGGRRIRPVATALERS